MKSFISKGIKLFPCIGASLVPTHLFIYASFFEKFTIKL